MHFNVLELNVQLLTLRACLYTIWHHLILPVLCVPGFGKHYCVPCFRDSESKRMKSCYRRYGWILGWNPSALTLEQIINTLSLLKLFLLIFDNFIHVYNEICYHLLPFLSSCPPHILSCPYVPFPISSLSLPPLLSFSFSVFLPKSIE